MNLFFKKKIKKLEEIDQGTGRSKKTQSSKIRNEIGDIINGLPEIKIYEAPLQIAMCPLQAGWMHSKKDTTVNTGWKKEKIWIGFIRDKEMGLTTKRNFPWRKARSQKAAWGLNQTFEGEVIPQVFKK